jgi:hypothetical protein
MDGGLGFDVLGDILEDVAERHWRVSWLRFAKEWTEF